METIEIKRLHQDDTADFRCLIEIFREVFENYGETPGNDHLGGLLANPGFMVFAVTTGGKVVGGLTVYILQQYYSAAPTAYIYDVGITPAYQGKGLGKALIAEVCNFCKANGFGEAYVEAESDDTDAVNFYRKTKFSSEMAAIHFTYSFSDETP